ncbi:unnamed protein product [Peniophora sp. CBMAI 1063]|nr:unnamed protein product [Peniophora sp. CBMAI 1063]
MLSVVVAYQIWVDVRKMLPLPFLNGVSGPCLPMALPGEAHLLGFFVAPLLFDTIITVMTLVRTIMIRRRNGPSGHLIQVFLKEGFMYFVLISSANLLNGMFYLQRNSEMSAIMIPLSIMLGPLLACRMVRTGLTAVVIVLNYSLGHQIIDLRIRAHDGSINIPRISRPTSGTACARSDHARPVEERESAPRSNVKRLPDVDLPSIELSDLSVDDPERKSESSVVAQAYHSVRLPLGQASAEDVQGDEETGYAVM